MKQFMAFVAAAIFLLSCQSENAANNGAATNGSEATVPDMHTAQTAIDWAGTYKGVLPCADCEGIETELMLHKDSTYMLRQTYLGKAAAPVVNTDGNWVWVDGNTIELLGIKNAPSKYHVGENKLFQLDAEGKRIEGDLAEKYILVKEQ
ncbi:MAG: copper resistance protein NlpE [Lacibacter sp.]